MHWSPWLVCCHSFSMRYFSNKNGESPDESESAAVESGANNFPPPSSQKFRVFGVVMLGWNDD